MPQRLRLIDASPTSCESSNSPWISAGCFISRRAAAVSAALGVLFWIYRSQIYSGDGDQLTRMVEGGVVFVQTELLSQAVFYFAYEILQPWGWDGFSVINLVSCIAGAAAVWMLLKFNRDFIGVNPLWGLGLFASSGLLLLCTGHTEYYTMFLATLFYYGYAGVGYLRGRFSSLHASLSFSLAVWMHMGIMFAFPSLLALPLLRKNWKDYYGLAGGLLLTAAAFIMKNHSTILGIEVQGLSPSKNFIPLLGDPSGERFYLMFEWGHLTDCLYAWTARSWIFWPAIFWAAATWGWRTLFQKERLFLFLYTIGFTFFTLTWHPNLGVYQDWDLFALESAPCLLLLMTYLPEWRRSSFRRAALAVPIAASIAIMYFHVVEEAHFGRRDYGSLRIELSQDLPHQVNLNGHLKELVNPAMRQGVYEGRLRNMRHMRSHVFYTQVAPDVETRFSLLVGPDRGRGGPTRDIGDGNNQKWRSSIEEEFQKNQ
ncbi:MAG: hypothetical protein JXR73_22950 [Candidatus Omnitrophica bacterium]|nr:hypothetical protein [Candidatus Omnitrophota bacterium]